MTIFELLTEYHRRLDVMKATLDRSGCDAVERIGIADAFQSDMQEWFQENGFCFACNRALTRCCCEQAA